MKENLIYPELSYKIIGILFDVYNKLCFGHYEKYYCNAIKKKLIENNLDFKEQLIVNLNIEGSKIGKYILDFLIEDKIVLEIKVGDNYNKKNIDQVYAYLKVTGKKLGVIANFTKKGIKYKRVVNIT